MTKNVFLAAPDPSVVVKNPVPKEEGAR